MQVFTLTRLLLASSMMALVGLSSLFFGMSTSNVAAEMQLEVKKEVVTVGDTFTVAVVVQSSVPTNVFAGEISYNPALLQVDSIAYNVSLADVWAEEPWYTDGEGTVSFAGGTTRPGGFIGNDTLLTITFVAVTRGAHPIDLSDVRILLHDGLGTDALVAPPIDTVVTAAVPPSSIGLLRQQDREHLVVIDTEHDPDLNGDGVVTIKDTSVFMQHVATQNLRSDFNADGKVSLTDYSIFSQLR